MDGQGREGVIGGKVVEVELVVIIVRGDGGDGEGGLASGRGDGEVGNLAVGGVEDGYLDVGTEEIVGHFGSIPREGEGGSVESGGDGEVVGAVGEDDVLGSEDVDALVVGEGLLTVDLDGERPRGCGAACDEATTDGLEEGAESLGHGGETVADGDLRCGARVSDLGGERAHYCETAPSGADDGADLADERAENALLVSSHCFRCVCARGRECWVCCPLRIRRSVFLLCQ